MTNIAPAPHTERTLSAKLELLRRTDLVAYRQLLILISCEYNFRLNHKKADVLPMKRPA
jgi:hypothetical protein